MRETASFFRALADETRLKMLWLLFKKRELCVCDLMEVLGITQSKASRHLRTLYNAGLVRVRREGLWAYYSLREPADSLVEMQLRTLRVVLAKKRDARALLVRLEKWLEHKASSARCR
jgi:ArsR family transcriptional regulator